MTGSEAPQGTPAGASLPRRAAPLVLVVLASLVVVLAPLLFGQSLNYNRWDNFEYYTPAIAHLHGHLLEGKIARVNFHQHLGEPLQANVQAGLVYPPYTAAMAIVKGFGLATDRLMLVIVLLHAPLCAAGVFAFLRAIGVRDPLAVAGALAASTGGYLLLYTAVWIFMLPIVTWLSWALLGCAWLSSDRHCAAGGFLLALSLAAVAWVGHAQLTLYAWVYVLSIALLAGWFRRGGTPPRLFRLVPCVLAGLLLSMPTVLPTLLYLPETARTGRFTLTEFVEQSATWSAMLGLLTPVLQVRNGFLTDLASPMLYQGAHVAPLILCLLALGVVRWVRRDIGDDGRRAAGDVLPWGLVVLGVSAVYLVFALGDRALLYPLTHAIPIWSSFRWPNKFLLFVNWGLAVAAAASAECLARRARAGLAGWKGRAIVCALVALVTALLLVSLPAAPARWPSGQLALVSGAAALLLVPRVHRSRAQWALVGATFVSGCALAALAQDIDLVPHREPYGAWGPARLGIDPSYRVLPLTRAEEIEPFGLSHSATANNYTSLTGCTHKFLPAAYGRLVPADDHGVPHRTWVGRLLRAHLLRSLNVRYLIAGKMDRAALAAIREIDDFERITELDAVEIYASRTALARAYFASEARPFASDALISGLVYNQAPIDAAYVVGLQSARRFAAGATILRAAWDDSGTVELAVRAPTEGLLVLSQLWMRDWSVTVDGSPAPILELNGGLMGVSVAGGARSIRFAYRPRGLLAGLLLAAGGLVLIGASMAVLRARSGRIQSPPRVLQDEEI